MPPSALSFVLIVHKIADILHSSLAVSCLSKHLAQAQYGVHYTSRLPITELPIIKVGE